MDVTQNMEMEIFPPGTRLFDTYTIVKRIGKGGMAFVYEADVDLDHFDFAFLLAGWNARKAKEGEPRECDHYYRVWKGKKTELLRQSVERLAIPYPRQGKCALKVLLPGTPQQERFTAEWRRLLAMDHPNLVEIYGGGEFVCHPYYAMALIVNRLPEDILFSLPLEDKLEIVLQTARGLKALHQCGIIHRDIKPSNLFVSRDEEGKISVKVGDLGISKQQNYSLTLTQNILGTPQFMPPEQMKDSRNVDERSDIYSLGASFYNLLTGKAPYEEESVAQTFLSVMEKIPPMPIRELNPAVPEGLEHVVMDRMMAFSPRKRFQNMDELLETMERIKKDPTLLHAGGTPFKTGTMVPKKRKAPASQKGRKVPSYPFFLIGGAVLLALLVSLYSWAFVPQKISPLVEGKQEENKAGTVGIREMVDEAIALFRKREYAACAKSLKAMDEYDWARERVSPSDPPFVRLLSFFYGKKWREALQVAPEVMKNSGPESGVEIFFCLRLFVCVGEHHMAWWYGEYGYANFPDFCRALYHPVFDIFNKGYYAAFQKLENWDPSLETLRFEKAMNSIYLRMVLVYPISASKFNLNSLEREWKKTVLQYRKTIPDWTDDFVRIWAKDHILAAGESVVPDYLRLLTRCPLLMEPRYRTATIVIERTGNFAGMKKNLEEICVHYPSFYPARLILGDFSTLDNTRYGQLEFIRHCLYCRILGCFISEDYPEANSYARLLYQWHPEWHFSRIYFGESLIACGRRQEGIKLVQQGFQMRSDNANLARRYMKALFMGGDLLGLSSLYCDLLFFKKDKRIEEVLDILEQNLKPVYTRTDHPLPKNLIALLIDFRTPATDQKIRDYEQVYASLPVSDRPPWGIVLARYLSYHGKYDRALSLFKELHPAMAHLSRYHIAQATCHLEKAKGMTGEARKEEFVLSFQGIKTSLEKDAFFVHDHLTWSKAKEIVKSLADAGELALAYEALDWLLKKAGGGSRLVEEKIYLGQKSGQRDEALLPAYDILVPAYMAVSAPSRYLERAEMCMRLEQYEKALADVRFLVYLLDVGHPQEAALNQRAMELLESLRKRN